MSGQIAVEKVTQAQSELDKLAQDIWEHPEEPFRETYACQQVAAFLKREGFSVEVGAGNVPTAIRATWGEGHPVMGLLGEYDALPALSQKVTDHKEPLVEGGYGHGCGHNLLAATTVGAAIGMKAEMEAKHIPGTIVFYGCPAEELLTGKPFMAREGCFRDLDIALAWHPGKMNVASAQGTCGCNSVKFHFKGVTAHAAYNPWDGRSALDAVSLLNSGVEFMREHINPEVRIHYVITEGGTAPNIVPDQATVWYYVRALQRDLVDDVYNRLVRAAKGAAMMTDTEVEVEFLGGCYPRRDNRVIAGVLDEAMRSIPFEELTEEENALARGLNMHAQKQWKNAVKNFGFSEDTQVYQGVAPIMDGYSYDSSDVGDVGHIVPTGFFFTATYNLGSVGHSWQATACAGSPIGRKAMHYGAKAMAMAGIRLMESEELREKAMDEFLKDTGGRDNYCCPIPADMELP